MQKKGLIEKKTRHISFFLLLIANQLMNVRLQPLARVRLGARPRPRAPRHDRQDRVRAARGARPRLLRHPRLQRPLREPRRRRQAPAARLLAAGGARVRAAAPRRPAPQRPQILRHRGRRPVQVHCARALSNVAQRLHQECGRDL